LLAQQPLDDAADVLPKVRPGRRHLPVDAGLDLASEEGVVVALLRAARPGGGVPGRRCHPGGGVKDFWEGRLGAYPGGGVTREEVSRTSGKGTSEHTSGI